MVNPIRTLSQNEQINFLLTNRIPRQLATRVMGRISRVENKTLTRFLIAIWRQFADDLDLSEARKADFDSLHDCFIRQLKDGARSVDQCDDAIVSPCDAILGSHGRVDGMTVFQAKGFPYELSDLIPGSSTREKYRDGVYATLRLKSSMYHRFHAPTDCRVMQVTYISGDTWNVNPVALKRIEKLYCKNERAVVELHLSRHEGSILLVPVAAILVASMRFNCLPQSLNLAYRGPNSIRCDSAYAKGAEIGYFEHGSTIILFASKEFALRDGLDEGDRLRMGEALLAPVARRGDVNRPEAS